MEIITYWTYPRYFKAQNFYPTAGRSELVQKSIYEYDKNGRVITTVTSNTFDPDNLYLKKTEVTTSKPGLNNIEQYKYPKDMIIEGRDPTGIYQSMVNAHIINPVVETIQHKGTQQILLSRKNYYTPFPAVYVPQEIVTQKGNLPIETRIKFHAYNNSGRPLTVSKYNDAMETYLWGYNNEVPVAHVIGENYSTVNLLIDQSILDSPLSDEQLTLELNKIRNALQNDKALVYTYSYNPLWGITSMTDAKGRSTYYEYDGFGRLSIIKDHDGNIIKRFCYKYSNKQEVCGSTVP